MAKRICSIEGCTTVHYGLGYCRRHYLYLKRNGDPLAVKKDYARVHTDGPCSTKRDRLRRSLIDEIKLSRGCEDPRCVGYPPIPAVLHFDHRDPATKLVNGISRWIHGRPWEDILAEIAKCDVVCANCHTVRTVEENRYTYRRPVVLTR